MPNRRQVDHSKPRKQVGSHRISVQAESRRRIKISVRLRTKILKVQKRFEPKVQAVN